MIQSPSMKKPVVSIIVPVFNTAEFLPRCLDSLLAQTLRDIEIVCVDDGSTDGSAEILRDYAAKDPRIVAVFQENHGVEWARAVAMEKASGRYVMFCDSDDAYKPRACERMAAAIEANGTDLVVCGTELRGRAEFSEKRAAKLHTDDVLAMPVSDGLRRNVCLWNKLFKREILNLTGLRFPKDPCIRRGFDAVFTFCYSLAAETATTLSECLVEYNQREGSLTDRRHKRTLRSTLDVVHAFPFALNFMDRNGFYDSGKERILKWFDRKLRGCLGFGRPEERTIGLRLVAEALDSRRNDITQATPWLFAAIRRDEAAVRRLLEKTSGQSHHSPFSRFHSVCLSALSRWLKGFRRTRDRNDQLH